MNNAVALRGGIAILPEYNQLAMKEHATNIVRELRQRGFQATLPEAACATCCSG